MLAALRGRETEATSLIGQAKAEATEHGEGLALAAACSFAALHSIWVSEIVRWSGEILDANNPALQRVDDYLRAIQQAELVQHTRHVCPNGCLAHMQRRGDLVVIPAARERIEDFALARTQARQWVGLVQMLFALAQEACAAAGEAAARRALIPPTEPREPLDSGGPFIIRLRNSDLPVPASPPVEKSSLPLPAGAPRRVDRSLPLPSGPAS